MAGSAALRGNELAEGFVTKGQRLLVQACRFGGKAGKARVSVSYLATPSRSVTGRRRWWTCPRPPAPTSSACSGSAST